MKTFRSGATSNMAKVIPLHQSFDSSSSYESNDQLFPSEITQPGMEKFLKQTIETAVFKAWMMTQFGEIEQQDNPFDAIYFSELKADEINSQVAESISRHYNIVDLSDTLSFSDGWDD